MTVDRDTWLAIWPRQDRRAGIASVNLPGTAEFGLAIIEHDADVPWTDYVRGSAWVFQQDGVEVRASTSCCTARAFRLRPVVVGRHRDTGIEPSIFATEASPGACAVEVK